MADEYVVALLRGLWQLPVPHDCKVLLVYIADRFNRKRGYAFPGVHTCAGECGMRLARASAGLQRLLTEGYLTIEDGSGTGTRARRYRLNFDKLGIVPPLRSVPAYGTQANDASVPTDGTQNHSASVPVFPPSVPSGGTEPKDQQDRNQDLPPNPPRSAKGAPRKRKRSIFKRCEKCGASVIGDEQFGLPAFYPCKACGNEDLWTQVLRCLVKTVQHDDLIAYFSGIEMHQAGTVIVVKAKTALLSETVATYYSSQITDALDSLGFGPIDVRFEPWAHECAR